MKKLLSAALSAVMLAGTLASCQAHSPKFSPKISVTSSEAEEYAMWLTDRLGTVPDNLILGTGDSAGIDMTEFENDGYVIRSRGDETVISGKTAEGLDLAVRKYAKAAKNGVGCEDTVYHEEYRIEKLTIADVDISEYTIYYSEDANENMKFAVSELQRLVKKACGAELEAVQGEAVGDYTIEFKHDTDPELRFDGYRYSVNGTHLTFEGAVKRGCMYAVWRFLQNECGWDGLVYGDSILAEAEHINIPDGLAKSETPAFQYFYLRHPYNGEFENEQAIPTNEQNSYGIMPKTTHGIAWYCYVANPREEQICYTNEERYAECLENVRADIVSRLESGQKIGQTFTGIELGQCDNGNYCTCDTCLEMFELEGGNAGAVVRFTNRLSEELNKDYPGLYYKIFAYMGTNAPPKVTKPNDSIHITFCTDSCCSNHTFDGTECNPVYGSETVRFTNDVYSGWLEGWTQLTDNIYVWLYTLDSGLMQYSTLGNIYTDFMYFYGLGIEGIMYQNEQYGLGVQDIFFQAAAELNWNKSMTSDEFEELMCRIMEKEFGDGWTEIRGYISMWEEAQNQSPCWHCWSWMWTYCDVPRFSTEYYSEHFEEMVGLVEKAVYLANSSTQERSAELFSCHIYYEGCYSSYYAAEDAGDRATLKKLEKYYDKMMGILEKYGYDPISEGITTVDGTKIKYSQRLIGAAVYDWIYCKDFLMYHEYWSENPFYQ